MGAIFSGDIHCPLLNAHVFEKIAPGEGEDKGEDEGEDGNSRMGKRSPDRLSKISSVGLIQSPQNACSFECDCLSDRGVLCPRNASCRP